MPKDLYWRRVAGSINLDILKGWATIQWNLTGFREGLEGNLKDSTSPVPEKKELLATAQSGDVLAGGRALLEWESW